MFKTRSCQLDKALLVFVFQGTESSITLIYFLYFYVLFIKCVVELNVLLITVSTFHSYPMVILGLDRNIKIYGYQSRTKNTEIILAPKTHWREADRTVVTTSQVQIQHAINILIGCDVHLWAEGNNSPMPYFNNQHNQKPNIHYNTMNHKMWTPTNSTLQNWWMSVTK